MSRQLTQAFLTEASGDQNRPLELVDIYLDDVQYYFVANNTDNITFYNAVSGESVQYQAVPMGREASSSSLGMEIDKLSVGIANVDRVIVQRLSAREFRGRRIVIRQVFANMLSDAANAVTLFDGLMDSPSVDQEWVSVSCTQRISSLTRKAPCRWYQLLCNWKFGSQASGECGIDTTISPYVKAKVVSAGSSTSRVSGDDIDEPAGRWRRGWVEFTSGALSGSRILVQTSGQHYLKLDGLLPSAPALGDNYTIHAGCDKTLFMCSGDWNNGVNFGGFNTIPENMVVK